MIVREAINKLLDLEPDMDFYVEIDGELFSLKGCRFVSESELEDEEVARNEISVLHVEESEADVFFQKFAGQGS